MCFKLSKLVYDCREKLSGTQKSILAYLAYRTGEKTGQCNPSFRRMELDTGFNKDTLVENIKYLVEKGWVSISKSFNSTNQYLINLDRFIVDKPVDEINGVRVDRTPSVRIGRTLVYGETVQNNHIKDHFIKDHMIEGVEICGQVLHAENILLELKWIKRDIKHYVKFFGAEKIIFEAKRVHEMYMLGKVKFEKRGAYLRRILENIDKRVKYNK